MHAPPYPFVYYPHPQYAPMPMPYPPPPGLAGTHMFQIWMMTYLRRFPFSGVGTPVYYMPGVPSHPGAPQPPYPGYPMYPVPVAGSKPTSEDSTPVSAAHPPAGAGQFPPRPDGSTAAPHHYPPYPYPVYGVPIPMEPTSIRGSPHESSSPKPRSEPTSAPVAVAYTSQPPGVYATAAAAAPAGAPSYPRPVAAMPGYPPHYYPVHGGYYVSPRPLRVESGPGASATGTVATSSAQSAPSSFERARLSAAESMLNTEPIMMPAWIPSPLPPALPAILKPPANTDSRSSTDTGRSKWSFDAVTALEKLVKSYNDTEIKREDFYANIHEELALLGFSHSKRAIQTKIGMLGLLNIVHVRFQWTDDEDKAALARLSRSDDLGQILQQLKARGLCIGRSLRDFDARYQSVYKSILEERRQARIQELGEAAVAEETNTFATRHVREWTREEEEAVEAAVRPYTSTGAPIIWHAVRETLTAKLLCLDRSENAIACHYRKTPRKRKRVGMRIPSQFHTDAELQQNRKMIRKALFSTPGDSLSNSDTEQQSEDEHVEEVAEKMEEGNLSVEENTNPWTEEEDELLLELILDSHPPYDWRAILARLQDRGLAMNRTTRQVLQRYCHHYQLEVPAVSVEAAFHGDKRNVAGQMSVNSEPSRRAELAKIDISETLNVMASTTVTRVRHSSQPEKVFPSFNHPFYAARTIIEGLRAANSSTYITKEIAGIAIVLGWQHHQPNPLTCLPITAGHVGGVWVRTGLAYESIAAREAVLNVDFFESNSQFADYLENTYPAPTG